ncbi:hypothetical protein GCM10010129_06460 [Streptomyces fumigatiscleroticus]|nr:hypothetical protein GCM10010129_06460 [Streptomyces fumigatiscleroticus]
MGQQTIAEYARQWLPRQRRMTEYSTGEHVNSSINVHIVPRLGSRKLNTVTPIVVERFLDALEADGVGRGNQVNIFRTLKMILRDAYDKRAMADDPVKGVQEPEYVREKVVIPTLAYVKQALGVAGDDLALEIVMMTGCGLRNGEAGAVNINNLAMRCHLGNPDTRRECVRTVLKGSRNAGASLVRGPSAADGVGTRSSGCLVFLLVYRQRYSEHEDGSVRSCGRVPGRSGRRGSHRRAGHRRRADRRPR